MTRTEQATQFDDKDFEDFEDLDTVLNSKEFNDLYNNTPETRPVSVYDNTGMTIEDISGFTELPHKWDNVTEL